MTAWLLPLFSDAVPPFECDNRTIARTTNRSWYPPTGNDDASWCLHRSQFWSVGLPIQDEAMQPTAQCRGDIKSLLP